MPIHVQRDYVIPSIVAALQEALQIICIDSSIGTQPAAIVHGHIVVPSGALRKRDPCIIFELHAACPLAVLAFIVITVHMQLAAGTHGDISTRVYAVVYIHRAVHRHGRIQIQVIPNRQSAVHHDLRGIGAPDVHILVPDLQTVCQRQRGLAAKIYFNPVRQCTGSRRRQLLLRQRFACALFGNTCRPVELPVAIFVPDEVALAACFDNAVAPEVATFITNIQFSVQVRIAVQPHVALVGQGHALVDSKGGHVDGQVNVLRNGQILADGQLGAAIVDLSAFCQRRFQRFKTANHLASIVPAADVHFVVLQFGLLGGQGSVIDDRTGLALLVFIGQILAIHPAALVDGQRAAHQKVVPHSGISVCADGQLTVNGERVVAVQDTLYGQRSPLSNIGHRALAGKCQLHTSRNGQILRQLDTLPAILAVNGHRVREEVRQRTGVDIGQRFLYLLIGVVALLQTNRHVFVRFRTFALRPRNRPFVLYCDGTILAEGYPTIVGHMAAGLYGKTPVPGIVFTICLHDQLAAILHCNGSWIQTRLCSHIQRTLYHQRCAAFDPAAHGTCRRSLVLTPDILFQCQRHAGRDGQSTVSLDDQRLFLGDRQILRHRHILVYLNGNGADVLLLERRQDRVPVELRPDLIVNADLFVHIDRGVLALDIGSLDGEIRLRQIQRAVHCQGAVDGQAAVPLAEGTARRNGHIAVDSHPAAAIDRTVHLQTAIERRGGVGTIDHAALRQHQRTIHRHRYIGGQGSSCRHGQSLARRKRHRGEESLRIRRRRQLQEGNAVHGAAHSQILRQRELQGLPQLRIAHYHIKILILRLTADAVKGGHGVLQRTGTGCLGIRQHFHAADSAGYVLFPRQIAAMLHRNDQTAAIVDSRSGADRPSVGNGNGLIAVHQLTARTDRDGRRCTGTEGLVVKNHTSVNGECTPIANAAVGVNSAVRFDLHGAYGQRLRCIDIRAALHRQLTGHG